MTLINNKINGAIAGGLAAEQVGASPDRIPVDLHAILDVMQEFRDDQEQDFFVDTWESTLIMKCALDAGIQGRFHDGASLNIDKLIFWAFREALSENSSGLKKTHEILTDPQVQGLDEFIEVVNTLKTVSGVIRWSEGDFMRGLNDLVDIAPDEALTHWIYGTIRGYHLGLTGIPKEVIKTIPVKVLERINEWTIWLTGINPESDSVEQSPAAKRIMTG